MKMKLKKEVKIILAVIALFIIGFIGIKAFGSKSADHDQPVSEATAITETAEEGKQENKIELEMHYKMSNEQGQIADCKMDICIES